MDGRLASINFFACKIPLLEKEGNVARFETTPYLSTALALSF
jgi:hypothetical protein